MRIPGQHLTTEEISLFADLLFNNDKEKIDDYLKKHVKHCDRCLRLVNLVFEIRYVVMHKQNISSTTAFKITHPRKKND